ncbi:hypothetical protein MLD38_019002 [Melastoma candidum]|uniref:Uncharacterized protein n=1 Tax=Melastoma candidum TaxID=119954 RepID=A0ACB9QVJ2_9MYRT|nr:hypothetical protein MLD38_019002 [Melastoma candidum]
MTYEPKDLDLRRPAPFRREGNMKFLSEFLTSAKAQRRVAREIKMARAFGLVPFTMMGTKPVMDGRTMENLDRDYGQRIR